MTWGGRVFWVLVAPFAVPAVLLTVRPPSSPPRPSRVGAVREPLELSAEERAEDATGSTALRPVRAPFDLAGVVDFFAGFDRPWWLVGGWSIEAFTRAPREHEDVDVSILACDAPALREFVGDRWHLWTIGTGRCGR